MQANSRPTAKELDLKLKNLVNWERLALQLPGIGQPDIDLIKRNHPYDAENQKLALYRKWLASDPVASWKSLIAALKAVDQNTIAYNLGADFEIPPQVSNASTKSYYCFSKQILLALTIAVVACAIPILAVILAKNSVSQEKSDEAVVSTTGSIGHRSLHEHDDPADLDVEKRIWMAGESGSAVVKKCVEKLQETGIFADDKGFMERVAFVMSRNGDAAFRLHTDGGIWQVGKYAFQDTKDETAHVRLPKKYQRLEDAFGIKWREVKRIDLEVPMISAIAARLYLSNFAESIPPKSKISKQQEYWWRFYMMNHEAKNHMDTSDFKRDLELIASYDTGQ